MTLTQDQIDAFAAKGYLAFGPLLDAEQIALLRTEYDREFAKARQAKTMRDLAQQDGKDTDVQVFQMMQMCERNIHFRKLLYHDTMLDVFSQIMGPNIQLYHDQALYKPPRTGGTVHWHQDNGYWRCRPASLVSCWITLDDVTRDSGAMQVIPGSHLTPIWHDQSADDALLTIPKPDTTKAQVIELPAGGCMFHHCQTLHYTEPNTTDRHRRALAIHVMPPGTIQKDKSLPISFKNPLLRCRIS